MSDNKPIGTMRERVIAVLRGDTPERPPFIDRMELWYRSMCEQNRLPEKYAGLSLNAVHRAVGMGRQKFTAPYALKLRGVEVIYSFEGDIIQRESEYVQRFLQTIDKRPIIVGVGDMVLENNLVGRVEYIAREIGNL